MTQTMQGSRYDVKENRRRIVPDSVSLRPVMVRVTLLAQTVATLVDDCFTQKARNYAPLVGPKQLSEARNTGGVVLDALRFMFACPTFSAHFRALVDATDESIQRTAAPCVETALDTHVVVDNAENVAKHTLMREREGSRYLAAMKAYRPTLAAEVAAGRQALIALDREIEREESR